MKAWFVFLINGEEIGTWACGLEEAKRNIETEFGDVQMKYLGNTCYDIDLKVSKVIRTNMSLTDMMIASGMLKAIR